MHEKKFIRDGTSATDIYEDLKNRIVSGQIAGGLPLRQEELARSFGVSKIPVREALRQLESSGLVEFRPRRGAIVADLSPDDILDLLDVRIALECRALELAVPNIVDDDIRLAQETLVEYLQETEAERWSELNTRFHQCLYEPCGRPHLLKFIRDLQNRMGPFLRLNVTLATGLERPDREHREILSACATGDAILAVQLLRKHIENTQKEVLAYFRRRESRRTTNLYPPA